jgi:hypothetical protein
VAYVDPGTHRQLWRLVEAYHVLVYFARERPRHYTALGLKGGWMGYFATRSAALGAVPPSVVTACFYGFAPAMVERALPDAWHLTTPERAVEARLAVFDEALHRLLDVPAARAALAEAARLAGEAVAACDPAGRPLFAAHAALPVPAEPQLALFWATAALREFRGDGHNAALLAAGVDGCAANVLAVAAGLVPAEQRAFRGWTEEQWRGACDRLAARGWLDADGRLTAAGRAARADIEDRTDAAGAEPWTVLGEQACGRLEELLTPLAVAIGADDDLPYPNPTGMPSAVRRG